MLAPDFRWTDDTRFALETVRHNAAWHIADLRRAIVSTVDEAAEGYGVRRDVGRLLAGLTRQGAARAAVADLLGNPLDIGAESIACAIEALADEGCLDHETACELYEVARHLHADAGISRAFDAMSYGSRILAARNIAAARQLGAGRTVSVAA